MSNISFTACGRCARTTVCEPITTGSVGLSVSFAFDAAWIGLQKTAIFRGSGMAVDLVLSGDSATVPPEVLTIPGGDLRVGVWGADPDGNVIIPTVWATVGEIVPGAAPSGIDPQPPAPSWAAQVQEIAQNALNTANSVREDADAGEFDGATYTPAVSAGGDLSWTNDKGKPNPPTVNIKGQEGQPGQTGATPDISIGTVTTGAAGSQASATMTGTPERPVLNLTIPKGDPGEVTQAEFAALSEEVADQKSAIEDLEAFTNRKAGLLRDTASGAIASLVPDATVPNLLGLTVDIEPVQDLHGYDSPWPAGGGVNKLSSDNMSRFTQKNYGVQYTVQADGGIAAAGTVTTTTWNFAQFYATLDDFGLSVGDTIALSCFGDNVNFAIHFYADNTMIRGIDAAGTPVGVIPEGTNRLRMIVYCKASAPPTVGEVINKTIYPQLEKASTPSTVWHPYSNLCPISGWDAVSIWNKPTHDTTLPPTVTIQLGQTVYGGALDVTAGTLTVDRAAVDLGTLGYSKSSFVQNGFVATGGMPDDFPLAPSSSAIPNWICSNYGNIVSNIAIESASVDYALAWRISGQNKGVIVKDSNYAGYYINNDMASFKAAMSGVQLVYELATPIEIQLDPVAVATIANQANNVWADAGDVDVTFAADVKNYIDQKIAAAVAAMS